jgi:NADH-quinone oxidoreductase subunit A
MVWIFVAGVAVVVLSMLGAYFLGPQSIKKATAMPYESGISIPAPSKIRFHVSFYVIALLFVIFDIESIFIYSWTTCIRELGWRGFGQIYILIAVLLLSLV